MTGLRQTFKKEHGGRTKNFSLANEASGQFRKPEKVTRPVYKPVLDAKGHVQFSSNNTRIVVENTNDGKIHHMQVAAIARYCNFVEAGKLQNITDKEKQDAKILAAAIKSKVNFTPQLKY